MKWTVLLMISWPYLPLLISLEIFTLARMKTKILDHLHVGEFLLRMLVDTCRDNDLRVTSSDENPRVSNAYKFFFRDVFDIKNLGMVSNNKIVLWLGFDLELFWFWNWFVFSVFVFSAIYLLLTQLCLISFWRQNFLSAAAASDNKKSVKWAIPPLQFVRSSVVSFGWKTS